MVHLIFDFNLNELRTGIDSRFEYLDPSSIVSQSLKSMISIHNDDFLREY